MLKGWLINIVLQMSNFLHYVLRVLNLAPYITFAKFDIALKNNFYVEIPNFDIDTQI